MKTFKDFQKISEQLKSFKTPEELSKKHNVPLSQIKLQLKKGSKVEAEHTKDKKLANVIASQHLDELPDYYTRLKKAEKVNEETKSGDSSLHDWFTKSRASDGTPGWVQLGGKYAGKPCAKQPGQTTKPKCGSSKMKAALSDKEEQKAFERKNRQDPDPDRKGSAKMVATEEKDACYSKVKSRYKVWPSAYACVPEKTTKALTRSGWKSVDELKLGEEILTHNLTKDELEFTPILNIHRYKNVKTNVVQSGNTGFIFECTDNHKWVINIPYQKSPIGTKYDKINEMFFMETKDLLERKTNKRLVVSAPYKGGSPIKKDLIYKYGDNWIKYILDITEEQRQSWLFSSLIYDGNQCIIQRKTQKPDLVEEKVWKYTSPHNKQSFGFKQKDLEHRDAFLLSAFLNGGTVCWKNCKNKNLYSCSYVSNKRFKNTSNFKLIEERIANVWCPETKNGTWIISQETNGKGIITITGNSGALVKCRRVGAKNWGNKSKDVKEEYTRLQANGNTYSILLNWRGVYRMIQMFISGGTRPTRDEISYEVNKIYPDAKVLNYKPSIKDPTKPYFIFTK